MIRRLFFVLVATAAVVLPLTMFAQQGATEVPRGIRRDVPMTNTIRRAFAAGTRDNTGRPGPNYWQLQTDYTINVRVDPATQTLTGTETIALKNNSPDSLRQILLRLDHNIFRARALYAAPWVPGEVTDGMVITKLVVNGDTLDPSTIPTTGRASAGAGKTTASGLDRTLASIALPPTSAIAPKSQAMLEIGWRVKLPAGPGSGHRMIQRLGDYLFQPTQWYPRIAVYDDLRGWDTNQYLGPSEFYNNFGKFDVSIDVPAGWIVSGTGVLQNPKEVYTPTALERLSHVLESDNVLTIVGENEFGPGKATVAGERLVWHLVADQVNDFAWATSNKYILKATRATIPGKGPIPLYIVHTPERARVYTNAAQNARHALEFYSKLWAPYPFPQFTMQDGPSDGMEYPMVINSSQGAADHEAGHQWWPMMVSNNETWYGWMDEGFNQYMNILSDADAAGQKPNLNAPGDNGQSYGATSGNESEPPMMWNANFGGSSYSFTTYGKTPLMLSMLGGIVGDENVQKAMSNYAKVWAFKHPSPWDYIFFMNSELKQDLNWFWYYWLWTTESVNGKIESVTTTAGRTTVVVRQDGEMPSPVVLRVQFADSGPAIKAMPNAKVDGNSALVTWPVDVWFNGSRTYRAVLDFGGRDIKSIQLDPSCRFPDRDPSDNVWPRPAASTTPAPSVPPRQQAAGTCGG
jgi:Peptidase family M1 domain